MGAFVGLLSKLFKRNSQAAFVAARNYLKFSDGSNRPEFPAGCRSAIAANTLGSDITRHIQRWPHLAPQDGSARAFLAWMNACIANSANDAAKAGIEAPVSLPREWQQCDLYHLYRELCHWSGHTPLTLRRRKGADGFGF